MLWPRKTAARGEPPRFHLSFGSETYPRDIAEDNFLFAGQRGSGKTLSIRLLTQSAIDAFLPGSKRRAVVYDPKGDWPSILHGMLKHRPADLPAVRPEVKLLNPFDQRGWAYDVAKDFASLGARRHPRPLVTVADGFAKSLMPESSLGNENRFWVSSAQSILSGIVQSITRHAVGRWSLADVISAACDERLTKEVLGRDPTTRRTLARFAVTGETQANVFQTLASFAWDIEPAALAWDYHLRQGRGLTAAEWFQGEDILVLAGTYDPPSAVEPINGVVMNFLREHLLAHDEVDWSDPAHAETWFILDEFPKLHTIRDMRDFFTLTRSKGGVQVIGFQSVTDVYERYGENAGNTVLGLCGTVGVLRLTCPKTAEYFEQRIGSYEAWRLYQSTSKQTSVSTSASQGGGVTRSQSETVSKQHQFHTLPGVLRQEFYLLNTVARHDLTVDGFYLLHGNFDRLPYSVRRAGLRDKADGFADFIPIDPAVCEPRPWAKEDFDRLGGVEVPKGYFEEERKPAPPRELLAGLGKRLVSPSRIQ